MNLFNRMQQVRYLRTKGNSNAEIAEQLGISTERVEEFANPRNVRTTNKTRLRRIRMLTDPAFRAEVNRAAKVKRWARRRRAES